MMRAGRPKSASSSSAARIMLAVLVDRGGRELPIHADVVGQTLTVPPGGRVDVFVPSLDQRDEVVLVGGSA
jgi:pyrimidine operon attenuation protein/uracil phosphoribosyltransferase